MSQATHPPLQHTLITASGDAQAGDSDAVQPWQAADCAGIDEVGIGPLAGPVVAAAVLLDPQRPVAGLMDSKKLSARKREQLAQQIRLHAASWALGWADEAEIDELNILRASHLAMQRACAGLRQTPRVVYVDGNKTPQLGMPCVAVVKGDQLIAQISAASILAKVARDEYMCDLDQRLPGYGFASHKGYPTRQHLAALQTLGASASHRRSFAPVRAVLPAVEGDER